MKKPLILFMLIFLNLDVLANLVIYALNTRDAKLRSIDPNGPGFAIPNWLQTVVPLLPVVFFVTAILLNLDNWIFMNFRVEEMKDLMQGKTIDKK